MIDYPKPPFPKQKQPMPGFTRKMDPVPDHGEQSYKGSGRLAGKKAIITGGDSGIGRAVALAFAREGADVLISYLSEHEDAEETKRLVEDAGRKAVLLPGDIKHAAHCRAIVDKAVSELGGVDILVNNAAHQASFKELEDISEEEWDLTFKVNIHAMFYLTKAAVPHMKPGSAIINTASINSDMPNPTLLAYATTKGAIQNFTAGLAQLLAPKGIRANAVAPGPIWTPLIPSTMPEEAVINFGKRLSSRPAPAVEVSAGKPRNEIGPMIDYPKPPFPKQHQPMPGYTDKMRPKPDHGEESYSGAGKLTGKRAIITGADSGIGRAVAIAYAREGADVLISYLSEHEDAEETKRLVEEAGRKAVLVAGDISTPRIAARSSRRP